MTKATSDNNHKSQNRAVYCVSRRPSGKKILVSICQSLEIERPGTHQEIVNTIANADISRKNRRLCEAQPSCSLNPKPDYIRCDNCRGKKLISSNTASSSESSSSSESGSDSEWYNDDKDITANVVKAKKRN